MSYLLALLVLPLRAFEYDTEHFFGSTATLRINTPLLYETDGVWQSPAWRFLPRTGALSVPTQISVSVRDCDLRSNVLAFYTAGQPSASTSLADPARTATVPNAELVYAENYNAADNSTFSVSRNFTLTAPALFVAFRCCATTTTATRNVTCTVDLSVAENARTATPSSFVFFVCTFGAVILVIIAIYAPRLCLRPDAELEETKYTHSYRVELFQAQKCAFWITAFIVLAVYFIVLPKLVT